MADQQFTRTEIQEVMTPAERWTFSADSYEHSEQGKVVMREANDWFVPTAVLERRLSMKEALERRSMIGTIPGGMVLDMFGQMRFPSEMKDGIKVAMRLSVPRKEDGVIADHVTSIDERPVVVFVSPDGNQRAMVEREGKTTPLVEEFFAHLQGFDYAYNPYLEGGRITGESQSASIEGAGSSK